MKGGVEAGEDGGGGHAHDHSPGHRHGERDIGSHQQYLELSVMVHRRVKYWKGLQPFNIG